MAFLFSACGQANYGLHVIFPDQHSLEITEQVELWALVAEAFRALGVMKDCNRRLEWKQRRRGIFSVI